VIAGHGGVRPQVGNEDRPGVCARMRRARRRDHRPARGRL